MELPGFDIEREVGRGGMARVYLAVQKKFGRLVALKVVSPDFAKDSDFRKRFLRESQINAQLTHPNIVQVYDVGLHEQYLYLVMEYLRGGDLNRALESGLRMVTLVGVVRDIAKALDYAHERGFVHRDIKPENILFREDGSAVLSDFGIAKVVGSDRDLTRLGTVMGTPQYMSPEQAAGRKLDGRSDIYSLGVVMYRMLTGDVPYKADSAVAIGIRHLQDPIPKLPNYFRAFQPLVDKSLAKKPEDRFQTGLEFCQALEEIQSSDLAPNPTLRSNIVTTAEIEAVGSEMLATTRDPLNERRAKERKRRRARVRYALAASVLVVAGAAGYVLNQERNWLEEALTLVGLGEDPALQRAWSGAQSLRQDPNQGLTAIVAAYRRVLVIAPDHEQAQNVLDGLAAEWKQAIRQAIDKDALNLAETKLEESRTAFPEDAELEELANMVTDRNRAVILIASTQGLLRSHGLSDVPSATAAIQAYQEVLRLHPENAVAKEELDRLAGHYAQLASDAAGVADVRGAIGYLDRATAANPDFAELANVRERIQQATTLRAEIDDILQRASEYRAADALIFPVGENAAELYHRVLATDPSNDVASQGLDEIVSRLLNSSEQLMAEGRFDEVRETVDRATAVGLDPGAINEMKSRLDAEAERVTRVAKLIAAARGHLASGYITLPADDNAVALLRDALRLDPGNPEAEQLLATSADRLAGVAREAHDAGMLEEAKLYLELALAITPDVESWRDLRDAWSENGG